LPLDEQLQHDDALRAAHVDDAKQRDAAQQRAHVSWAHDRDDVAVLLKNWIDRER
jgi:hypothetical protein